MRNLIKYELKGDFKLFGIVFAIAALLNVGLFSRIGKWDEQLIILFSGMVSSFLFLTILIFVIKSFEKEMYEDRGYLTFTLPVSGRKIVGSKIITALIWFAVAGIVSLIFGRILIGLIYGQSSINELTAYFSTYINIKVILSGILFVIINTITLLLLIYFSITITRVALKGKRVSKFLGFVVFIALNAAIVYIQYKLIHLFPQTVSFMPEFLQNFRGDGDIMKLGEEALITMNNSGININIAGLIYNIAVYVGLFLGTGYLIDNKIDI
ncbi:ABC-2 transporter permease [Clostridium peptidivorans]|uniref:ABC-2 transporter permease n=1 Tax=Clostridium peptidivorans TaxID=100174 RepID=UPI000BE2E81C|nr:ABC-2 transporter permease [Clostridium peptidivorans]